MPVWLWALSSVVALFVLLALGGWWLMRNLSADSRALVGRIGRLSLRAKGRLALALVREPRVPLWLRMLVPALVLYLAIPIDIIPDFIPVLGHLDDALIALVVVAVVLRFTPRDLMEAHLSRLEAAPPTPAP